MGILVEIDTTSYDKLEHACFEVWPSPWILHAQISLADNVHHQMTATVAIGYAHTHIVGILITNENPSRSVVSRESLPVHDSGTGVYIHCNVVADTTPVNSANSDFIHYIKVVIYGHIVCIYGHTVV